VFVRSWACARRDSGEEDRGGWRGAGIGSRGAPCASAVHASEGRSRSITVFEMGCRGRRRARSCELANMLEMVELRRPPERVPSLGVHRGYDRVLALFRSRVRERPHTFAFGVRSTEHGSTRIYA